MNQLGLDVLFHRYRIEQCPFYLLFLLEISAYFITSDCIYVKVPGNANITKIRFVLHLST